MTTPYHVLWWVEAGTEPSLIEAKERLECLQKIGPSELAFTFKARFPSTETI